MNTERYCYWSVCTGEHAARMEQCVRSAHAAGVFKQFHVLTDRPVEGCECYDAYECDKANGLFKLHYMKVGISRLPFDYFIWLDADSLFLKNPVDVLAPLGRSPIHVPLELSLAGCVEDVPWRGTSIFEIRQAFGERGVLNEPYLSGSAFWIIKREAIDSVYELAMEFWNWAKGKGTVFHVDVALGYAMQMLCANPEAHLVQAWPEVWLNAESGQPSGAQNDKGDREWRHNLGGDRIVGSPAIVHVGRHGFDAGFVPARERPAAEIQLLECMHKNC